MSAHPAPAGLERCACGTAHRSPDTWAKCPANRAGAIPAPRTEQPTPPATGERADVTASDLRAALDSFDLAVILIGAGDGLAAIIAPAWCAGEVLADRADIISLVTHHGGSLAAAAADLSLAVAFERTQAVAP